MTTIWGGFHIIIVERNKNDFFDPERVNRPLLK